MCSSDLRFRVFNRRKCSKLSARVGNSQISGVYGVPCHRGPPLNVLYRESGVFLITSQGPPSKNERVIGAAPAGVAPMTQGPYTTLLREDIVCDYRRRTLYFLIVTSFPVRKACPPC